MDEGRQENISLHKQIIDARPRAGKALEELFRLIIAKNDTELDDALREYLTADLKVSELEQAITTLQRGRMECLRLDLAEARET